MKLEYRNIILIIIISLLFQFVPFIANACSCIDTYEDVSFNAEHAQIVFLGEVIEIEEIDNEDKCLFTFKPIDIVRGNISEQYTVPGECNEKFYNGEKYQKIEKGHQLIVMDNFLISEYRTTWKRSFPYIMLDRYCDYYCSCGEGYYPNHHIFDYHSDYWESIKKELVEQIVRPHDLWVDVNNEGKNINSYGCDLGPSFSYIYKPVEKVFIEKVFSQGELIEGSEVLIEDYSDYNLRIYFLTFILGGIIIIILIYVWRKKRKLRNEAKFK